jgi:hypothetical protein
VWDLDRDGLTYSLISDWLGDRERYRIKVVEGLVSDTFNIPLEFGNMFHFCLEHSHKLSDTKIKSMLNEWYVARVKREGLTGTRSETLLQCMEMVWTYFIRYKDYWKENNKSFKFVQTEEKFAMPYTITPSIRPILLKGKVDGVVRVGKELWLFETKTKSSIPSDMLTILPENLQTCMYAVLMSIKYKQPISGVIWNGIRRPSIKQTDKDKTYTGYLARLNQDIIDRPDFYFTRFECRFLPGDLQRWEHRCFKPLLASIVEWWDSIKKNPFDPWVNEKGEPNVHHFIRPYGVYDPLTYGSDLYLDYIANGSTVGLKRVTDLSPELASD